MSEGSFCCLLCESGLDLYHDVPYLPETEGRHQISGQFWYAAYFAIEGGLLCIRRHKLGSRLLNLPSFEEISLDHRCLDPNSV